MATLGSPINQADVQNALGVSSSVNKWSLLIAHGNTNKWSGYKPLYATKVTRLTDAERASGAHVIEGYSASYGMQKRVSDVWSDFMDRYGNIISAPWIYDKPVLDGSCKFRITDFVGYRTDAPRIVNVSFSSGSDIWIPSAAGSTGYGFWIQLTGMSSVASQNTGAMRWQELFGDCLDYYPTVIMTAGTSWVYAKSYGTTDNRLRIRDLISRGDTGAIIYVNSATLANAMISDGSSYDHFPLNNNVSWNMCMVLSSTWISGDTGTLQHNIPTGTRILRCEYEAGADRTVKTGKLLKYKAFSSMKMKAKLVREGSTGYKYRLDELSLIAEKLTQDAVSFTCTAMLTARIGSVNVQGRGSATDGRALEVDNYLGSVSFAAGDIGTVTKTWKYNDTSGNGLPYTTYDITNPETGSGQRNPYGNFTFGNDSIGYFSGGWSGGDINVNSQWSQYNIELTLF